MNSTPAPPSSKNERTWTFTTKDGDIGVLTYEPLDQAKIEELVKSPKAGAVVTFTGYTRDSFQDKTVTHLEYETYPSLALKTLSQVLEAARNLDPPIPSIPHPGCNHPTTHPSESQVTTTSTTTTVTTTKTSPNSNPPPIEITRIVAYHLLGPCPVGTSSIIISVSSPHRKEAFVVCEYVLEEIKHKVQVWKREYYQSQPRDGDGEGGGGEQVFVGQDGQGPNSTTSRGEKDGRDFALKNDEDWAWKANHPVATTDTSSIGTGRAER